VDGPAPYWQTFTYDSAGNRKAATDQLTAGGPSATTYAYKTADQLRPHALASSSTTGPSGAVTASNSYTYDLAGNTKSRTLDGKEQGLHWDVEGKPDEVTEASGDKTSYLNDGDGNRLIRRDKSGTTLYLGNTELRLDKTTNAVSATRYYNHAGQVVAVRTPSQLTWVVGDHHGTASLQIDATSQAVQHRRSTPFGETRGSKSSAWTGEKGFVGGTDDPTGLTHLGAREYDPTAGRFISADPVLDVKDPQQINAYVYSNNNPVSFSDPSGLIMGGTGIVGLHAVENQAIDAAIDKATSSNSSSGNDTDTCTSHLFASITVSCSDPSAIHPEPADPRALGDWKDMLAGMGRLLAEISDFGNSVQPICWAFDCGSAADSYDKVVGDHGIDTNSIAYDAGDAAANLVSLASTPGAFAKVMDRIAVMGAKEAAKVSPWSLPARERGLAIEDMRGGNLPVNFPTIDKWDPATGIATSIKTVDTRLDSYAKASRVRGVGRKYVRDMAAFQGRSWGGVTVDASDIRRRELEIGVPDGGMSHEQADALKDVVRYGSTQGVTVTIFYVP
jgi:RHS repeat-associated protein